MVNFEEQEKDFILEFNRLKPKLHLWGKFIDDFITDVIIKNPKLSHLIQIKPTYRVKTDKSIIRKVFYKDKTIRASPLLNIEDKVGTRVVFTHLEAISEFRTEFEEEFKKLGNFKISRDFNTCLKNPKAFDYNSLHYILTPSNKIEYFGSMNKEDLEYYSCELQVKTLLQHAYAEVSHDTIYKGAFSGSSEMIRTMSRSMALMEAAESYFMTSIELMGEKDTYATSYLNQLISLAGDKLDKDLEFSSKNVDFYLTINLFEKFNIEEIEINEIEKVLTQNSSDISRMLKSMNGYLRDQPVVILIIYLILTYNSQLREKWDLEWDIIREISNKLGISTRD